MIAIVSCCRCCVPIIGGRSIALPPRNSMRWCKQPLSGSVLVIRYCAEWWSQYRPGPRRQPLHEGCVG
jgi:hypothetical protein